VLNLGIRQSENTHVEVGQQPRDSAEVLGGLNLVENDPEALTEQHAGDAGSLLFPAQDRLWYGGGPRNSGLSRMVRRSPLLLVLALAAGCGEIGPGMTAPAAPTVREALLEPVEQVESLSPAIRAELYRALLRDSGGEAQDGVLALFPMVQNGTLRAAPQLEGRLDLLEVPDGGEPLLLNLDGLSAERWPTDRSDSLQGLSEREAAELVARSLAARWSLRPKSALRVERASGVPYAAAYADGLLRINPNLLYLAAAPPEGR